MSKQNQVHEQLYRPFPYQNPQSRPHDCLSLDSNCTCPPCKSRPDQLVSQIEFDYDLQLLKQKYSHAQINKKYSTGNGNINNGSSYFQNNTRTSDFIIFLNQIYRQHTINVPNIQMLDTIVFNSDGSVKYVINYQSSRLKILKLTTTLKNYLNQRKYINDLQYQKRKFQREHMGFTFTQLDHQSQKYIKQFQNNIKYMNPLLNRVVIAKYRNKKQEEILSQNQLNSLFVKITRKLFDFTCMEYMQIFPIMYGHQQSSYVKKIKYFRQRQINKKNYKIAEHYIGNWSSKNQTLENLQNQFLRTIRHNQDQLLMYYTYKIFIYYQKIANKMVQCALVQYITNDQGNNFYLKNIQYFNLFSLHEVEQHVNELPRKLENDDPNSYIQLKKCMKNQFDGFQLNYNRLERQRIQMENKLQADIDFSNRVYESLGNTIPKFNKSDSFVKSIFQQYSGEKGKISMSQNKKSSYHQ